MADPVHRLVLLLVLAVAAPVASADDVATLVIESNDGVLYAHWPEDATPGDGSEVPMSTMPPWGEPDLSSGRAVPGVTPGGDTTGAGLPTFIYTFTNSSGGQGVADDVFFDASTPAMLVVFLSADQTVAPGGVPIPPEADHDIGVAPAVTVEAELYLAGVLAGTGRLTQDLVSTPATQTVYRYDVMIPLEADEVPAGAGITVVWRIYQIDATGERAMQNMWNINTGEEYPTGIVLPAINPRAFTTPPMGMGLVPTSAAGADEVNRSPSVPMAAIVLAGSIIGMVATGIHAWRARD